MTGTTVIEFETRYTETGDPQDYVLLAPRGAHFDKIRSWHRVKDLRPPEGKDARTLQSSHYQAMRARWEIISPAFDAWKNEMALPDEGMPLEAWPGVNKTQIQILKGMGFRTVEQIAEMDESAVGRLRWPSARKLPETAKRYIEGQDIVAKDAELDEMKKRLAAMEEMVNKNAEAKRGPGRPRKSEAA